MHRHGELPRNVRACALWLVAVAFFVADESAGQQVTEPAPKDDEVWRTGADCADFGVGDLGVDIHVCDDDATDLTTTCCGCTNFAPDGGRPNPRGTEKPRSFSRRL